MYIYIAQSCNAPFALQARYSLSWMLDDIIVQDVDCSAAHHSEAWLDGLTAFFFFYCHMFVCVCVHVHLNPMGCAKCTQMHVFHGNLSSFASTGTSLCCNGDFW